MKELAILGSTGSIGKNCLAIAKHLGKDAVRVVAIAARHNIKLLEEQAREFNPKLIAVYDLDQALELQKRIPQEHTRHHTSKKSLAIPSARNNPEGFNDSTFPSIRASPSASSVAI